MSSSTDLTEVAKSICEVLGYEFIASAGRGAFKQTFQVKSDEGNLVALKVHLPGGSQERQTREITAMKRCDHPRIGKFYEVGTVEVGGTPYVWNSEEFLDGGNLTEQIKNKRLSREETILLGSDLIEGLAHIASLNLVHRDLKPDNVMFRKTEARPIIVDFGLVRNLGESSLTQTWQPQGPGTPLFSAPEQLNNEKELIDWRTDQFALGLVLSISVFGVHPYARPGDQPVTVVQRMAQRQSFSPEFEKMAHDLDLKPLLNMVAPWSIRRFRTTDILQTAWTGRSK